MYAVISIGNTDNKLTQQEWSRFVTEVGDAVNELAIVTHFMGGASNWMPWQNVAWILEVSDNRCVELKHALKEVRQRYHQDSVFFSTGIAEFV